MRTPVLLLFNHVLSNPLRPSQSHSLSSLIHLGLQLSSSLIFFFTHPTYIFISTVLKRWVKLIFTNLVFLHSSDKHVHVPAMWKLVLPFQCYWDFININDEHLKDDTWCSQKIDNIMFTIKGNINKINVNIRTSQHQLGPIQSYIQLKSPALLDINHFLTWLFSSPSHPITSCG